jgi:hypothetical protein
MIFNNSKTLGYNQYNLEYITDKAVVKVSNLLKKMKMTQKKIKLNFLNKDNC